MLARMEGTLGPQVAAVTLSKGALLTSGVGVLVVGMGLGSLLTVTLSTSKDIPQQLRPQDSVPATKTAPPSVDPIDAGTTFPRTSEKRERPVRVLPAPAAGRPDESVGSRDVDLSAERTLLELARTALSRGEPSVALEALGQHEQTFAAGRLVEEREVLLIEALIRTGRKSDAQARAESFRSRFPESLLQPAIDAALEPR